MCSYFDIYRSQLSMVEKKHIKTYSKQLLEKEILQRFRRGVTEVLQRFFLECFRCTSMVLSLLFWGVIGLFQECRRVFKGLYMGSYRGFTTVLQKCYIGVTMVIKNVFSSFFLRTFTYFYFFLLNCHALPAFYCMI